MTFLLYLCKVFLCSGILLGYYWLFLRNKQFHRYNRFYLLGTMVASVILPFFKIRIWDQPQNPVTQVVYQTVDVLTVGYGESDGQLPIHIPAADLFAVDHLLYIVYAAGVLGLLVLLAKSLLYIRRIARQYPHEVINRLKFYTTSEPGTPFSFFHSIFWNEQLGFNSKEGQQIFRHELFHIRQRHTTDVLLAELITALFWCNPFFHIAKKELKAIHEFLADQYAASGSDRYAYAELLVLQTLHARHIPVTHRFFQNHIKRRIAMITHLNTRNYNYWSRLMVLPVAVLLFCSFALYAQQPGSATASENGEPKNAITVVIDAGHGGTDNGAVNADGLFEKDIALQISLKIQQLAPAYNVNVVMTRAGNELPSHATIKEDGIRARTTIAQQSKAAAFVSIHMAAVDNTNDVRSGMEIYVTRENEQWMAPSKQLGTAVLQSISTLYTANPALLQRKQKGIWVLDHSPCPAILIECGYITDKKDVAFFTNSKNQEALAKKILEGIVTFRKQHDNASTIKQVPAVVLTDSVVLSKLSRHFNRNIRYPEPAYSNNAEGNVFFSLDVDQHAKVSNFQLYNEAPATAKLHKVVTVGMLSEDTSSNKGTSSAAMSSVFKDEIKRVAEKPINMNELTNTTPFTYYFQAIFVKEKGETPSVVYPD